MAEAGQWNVVGITWSFSFLLEKTLLSSDLRRSGFTPLTFVHCHSLGIETIRTGLPLHPLEGDEGEDKGA